MFEFKCRMAWITMALFRRSGYRLADKKMRQFAVFSRAATLLNSFAFGI